MNKLALSNAFFVVGVLFPICVVASQSNVTPTTNASALAQQQSPAIVITIRDTVHTPQGVAVPGAAVLLHVTSGKVWETSTDDEGEFFVPDLPAGRYRIEAHQLGLGSALWENDTHNSSSGTSAASEQIELTLRRSVPAGTASGSVPSNTAKSAINAKAAINPSTSNQSHKADVAADQSDNRTKKSGKSKKDGFEQVEPTDVLTATSDPGQQVATPAPPAVSANTQSASAESYLISGAVGRGSTAETTNTNGQDDSIGPEDEANNSGKHHHHSGSGHSGSKKAFGHLLLACRWR